jgi:hypothetical protein
METGRRVVAFEEVKALASVYGTNIAAVDLQVDAYDAAMSHPVRRPVKSAKGRR